MLGLQKSRNHQLCFVKDFLVLLEKQIFIEELQSSLSYVN